VSTRPDAEPTVVVAFPDRVAEAVERKRSQLVVGLDPRIDLLPVELRGEAVCGGKLAGAHDFGWVLLEQHHHIEHVLRTPSAKLEMDEGRQVDELERFAVAERNVYDVVPVDRSQRRQNVELDPFENTLQAVEVSPGRSPRRADRRCVPASDRWVSKASRLAGAPKPHRGLGDLAALEQSLPHLLQHAVRRAKRRRLRGESCNRVAMGLRQSEPLGGELVVGPGTAAAGRRDAPSSKPFAPGKLAQGRIDDSLAQADPAAATVAARWARRFANKLRSRAAPGANLVDRDLRPQMGRVSAAFDEDVPGPGAHESQ